LHLRRDQQAGPRFLDQVFHSGAEKIDQRKCKDQPVSPLALLSDESENEDKRKEKKVVVYELGYRGKQGDAQLAGPHGYDIEHHFPV